jgi:ligand-binding SRPBCC domain-containing protein
VDNGGSVQETHVWGHPPRLSAGAKPGCLGGCERLRTMNHRLQFEDWVPFPVPRVFAFFSNPQNLPRIMPASTQTRIDELHRVPPPPPQGSPAYPYTAGVGTVIVTSFRLFPFLPLRAQWIARITEFEWNHYFADVQEKGPFKLWNHRHEFLHETRDGVSGTLVRDVIEYEVGFGPLGALADALFVAHQMRNTFAKRQQILPKLLSAS